MKTEKEVLELYPDVDINTDGGADSYKEGLSIVERESLAVIIKHPTDDLYLIADWKKSNWKGFLTGGIEGNDSLEETVKREIHEETGYKNISEIKSLNFVTHALFFHPVKSVNRLTHYNLVFAQLSDLDRDNVSEEERNIADFIWIPSRDVLNLLTREGIKDLWRFYSEYSKN